MLHSDPFEKEENGKKHDFLTEEEEEKKIKIIRMGCKMQVRHLQTEAKRSPEKTWRKKVFIQLF